jgi:hypothetical protein
VYSRIDFQHESRCLCTLPISVGQVGCVFLLAKRATSSDTGSLQRAAVVVLHLQAGGPAAESRAAGDLQRRRRGAKPVGKNWTGMVMSGHKNIKHMDGHRWTWMDIGWVDNRWVGRGWVDIGGVDIGWVSFRCVVVVARSGRVRGSLGGDGREA